MRENTKKWKASNREKVREQKERWKVRKREKVRELRIRLKRHRFYDERKMYEEKYGLRVRDMSVVLFDYRKAEELKSLEKKRQEKIKEQLVKEMEEMLKDFMPDSERSPLPAPDPDQEEIFKDFTPLSKLSPLPSSDSDSEVDPEPEKELQEILN